MYVPGPSVAGRGRDHDGGPQVTSRDHCHAQRLTTSGVALAMLLAAGPAWAVTITRGPFIQNPDALTSTMTIEWWTDTAGDSMVEYGLTTALGSSVTVGQAGSCEVGGAGTCHTVPITGLLPGAQDFYQLPTGR